MNKIIVIGCPGAGKSTFARRLHEKTKIPLFYLDMIWHQEDKSTVSREQFNFEMNEILKLDRWIIDGNYMRTIPVRLQRCDTVFLLDYPLDICIAGVESRIGKSRVDMPWTETEFDPEFRQWILDFPQKQLPKIYSWLQAYPDKEIHIFKSREEADEFIKYGLL